MTEVFPIESLRMARVRRMQTVQHAFAAIMLITTAWSHLGDPHSHSRILPLLEIATAVALLVTIVVEKTRKHQHNSRVGWLELAGAAMTYVEAFAKLSQKHHLSFYILSFIPPTILLFFGLFDGRIREGLRLAASDEHFELRLRPIRRRRFRWDDLRAYRMTPTHIELTRDGGKVTRVKVTDIRNRELAMAWAEEQFRTRGIPAAGEAPQPA